MIISGQQLGYPFSLFPRGAKNHHHHHNNKTVLKLCYYLHNSTHLIQKGNGLVVVSASKEDKATHNKEKCQTGVKGKKKNTTERECCITSKIG